MDAEYVTYLREQLTACEDATTGTPEWDRWYPVWDGCHALLVERDADASALEAAQAELGSALAQVAALKTEHADSRAVIEDYNALAPQQYQLVDRLAKRVAAAERAHDVLGRISYADAAGLSYETLMALNEARALLVSFDTPHSDELECDCTHACTHLTDEFDDQGYRYTQLGLRNVKARHSFDTPQEPS